eukprot:IDg19340t1
MHVADETYSKNSGATDAAISMETKSGLTSSAVRALRRFFRKLCCAGQRKERMLGKSTSVPAKQRKFLHKKSFSVVEFP